MAIYTDTDNGLSVLRASLLIIHKMVAESDTPSLVLMTLKEHLEENPKGSYSFNSPTEVNKLLTFYSK